MYATLSHHRSLQQVSYPLPFNYQYQLISFKDTLNDRAGLHAIKLIRPKGIRAENDGDPSEALQLYISSLTNTTLITLA